MELCFIIGRSAMSNDGSTMTNSFTGASEGETISTSFFCVELPRYFSKRATRFESFKSNDIANFSLVVNA